MANFLTLNRSDSHEEQVRLFTHNSEKVKVEEITNEDLQTAEKQEVDQMINSFFGFDGGIDDLANAYKGDIEMLAEKTKDEVIKKVDLKSNVDDPFHEKEYERQKSVFTKKVIENKEDVMMSTPSFSESDGYVKDTLSYNTSSPSGYKSGYGSTSTSRTTSNSGYGSNSSTAKTTAPKPNERVKLNDRIAFVADNVMDVAAKPMRGWKEKEVIVEGWGSGKKNWKRRFKSFMSSKKAKILLKTGMLMSLQLGMAMVGKKYEFEGMGQASMFLGMMLGVFYLTRELAEDGFDPRGFGIL